MFSRAGFDTDYAILLTASVSGHVALLCVFACGDYAWYFPRFDCFRWTGVYRSRNFLERETLWGLPKSFLPA